MNASARLERLDCPLVVAIRQMYEKYNSLLFVAYTIGAPFQALRSRTGLKNRENLMTNLTYILDRVASELESRGLRKLAAELDLVANTLDREQEAFPGVSWTPGSLPVGTEGFGIREAGDPSLYDAHNPGFDGAVFTGSSIKTDGNTTREWKGAVGTGAYRKKLDGSIMIEVVEPGAPRADSRTMIL